MPPEFAKLKGMDKEFAVDDAARTISEFGRISAEPKLMKAAQKKIEDDAKMAKATELFVKAVNRNPLDRKKKKT